MVHTCCVPNCRGNYDKNNKVHIFSFPRDDELKLKWIKAINRKDLVVTKNTKVCEKHFKEGDVLFITSFYKEETGETLTAKMKKPRLKEGAIPAIFPSCPPSSITTKKSRAVSSKFRKQKLPPKTDTGTESQHATKPSTAIKQEPVECTDEPPPLVIGNIHSVKELVPSTSSSSLSSSLPLFSSSSIFIKSTPFPQNALPVANPDSINVDTTPVTIKSERKGKINDVKPDASDSTPSATQDKLDRLVIKQELESTDEPPPLVFDNILSVKEMVSSSSNSPLFISSSPFPQNSLPVDNPDSTNVNETPVSNKPERKRKIDDIKPDGSDSTPSATRAKLHRFVIKQELVESTDEPTPLVFDNILSVKDLIPSSSNLPPTSSIPSSSSSPLFISSSSFPENALPVANPDSTDVNETPETNKPERKRKINDIKLDTSDSTPSVTQAKLNRLVKPSMSSKKSSKPHRPSGTTKSAGRSISPTEDTQNATRDIFQSLMSASGNNPLSGSRTRERPGDLFDMFAVFIAEKLRQMNGDNCAFALRSILDIVFKGDQVQQCSEEEDSDISDSATSSTSSSDQE